MTFRRAALATALLVPTAVVAQTARNGGPYAPLVLTLPSGPRSLALGNTGIASRDDEAVFFNPAQIVIARGFAVSAERYSASAAGGSLSSVTRFNTGGIAFGMRMADYKAPIGAFPSDRETLAGGGPAPGTSLEATVGIGQVFKGVRVGGAVKYAEDNAAALRVQRAALDLGVSKDMFRYYTFGLAVQNIGESLQLASANLPLRTTLGAATQRSVGEFDLMATAAVSMLRTDFFAPSGGVELGYGWLDGYSVALRAGARRPMPGEGALTAGLGYNMDRLSIDYALEMLAGSRTAHRVGLRIR